MNRRFFLSATLVGTAVLTASRPAAAMEVVDCETSPGADSCRKLTEHAEILQKLDAMLAEKGLTEDQRKTALAASTCPFCGLPLVSTGAF